MIPHLNHSFGLKVNTVLLLTFLPPSPSTLSFSSSPVMLVSWQVLERGNQAPVLGFAPPVALPGTWMPQTHPLLVLSLPSIPGSSITLLEGLPGPCIRQQPCPALWHRSAHLITVDAGPDQLVDPLYVGSFLHLLWAEMFPHPDSRAEVPALGTSECSLQTQRDPTALAPDPAISSASL